MSHNAIFSACGNSLTIRNFRYYPQDRFYNIVFDLEVRSGMFSGTASLEYDMEHFRRFIQELTEMYDFQRQTVTLKEFGYGSELLLEADKTGHVIVSGWIHGHAMEHSLHFTFTADQTMLGTFIGDLRRLAAE